MAETNELPIHLYGEVGSTNDLALAADRKGAPHGACWVADRQSAGRGRREVGGQRRVWFSPPSSSIYMSVLLRPDLEPARAAGLTLAAGVGLCEALSPVVDAWLKWPNDLYVGRRKLGGVLTEAVTTSRGLEAVVVGLGLNVNVSADEVPEELRPIMTSTLIELGIKLDRLALLAPLRDGILRWCERYVDGGLDALYDDLQRHDRSPGHRVEVFPNGEPLSGVARGIDRQGQLRVDLDDGTSMAVATGEAKLHF